MMAYCALPGPRAERVLFESRAMSFAAAKILFNFQRTRKFVESLVRFCDAADEGSEDLEFFPRKLEVILGGQRFLSCSCWWLQKSLLVTELNDVY